MLNSSTECECVRGRGEGGWREGGEGERGRERLIPCLMLQMHSGFLRLLSVSVRDLLIIALWTNRCFIHKICGKQWCPSDSLFSEESTVGILLYKHEARGWNRWQQWALVWDWMKTCVLRKNEVYWWNCFHLPLVSLIKLSWVVLLFCN